MNKNEGELHGLGLVLASLMFDGMTQTQTDKQHKSSKRDTAYPTMFTNNCFGAVLSLSFYVYNVVVHGDDTHVRLMNNSSLFMSCVTIGLMGTLGQVFVFFTVSLFDCYFLTIITTTRKFFSVVYSNFIFGHNFTNQQWFGAAIVMACTMVELGSSKGDKSKKTEDADKKAK
jgi:UDP-galactose transporter B1